MSRSTRSVVGALVVVVMLATVLKSQIGDRTEAVRQAVVAGRARNIRKGLAATG